MRKALCVVLMMLLMIPAASAAKQTEILLSDAGVKVDGSGVKVSGSTVTITKAGTYLLSGSFQGQIRVKASGKATVTLLLQGVEVTNEAEAALYVEDAGQVELVTGAGTINVFRTGETPDEAAMLTGAEETATGGAIYVRDDLVLSGEGTLQVIGGLNNGIHGTNEVTICSGTVQVTALNHGIKGKDAMRITGGSVQVNCGGDALRSDDETGEGYGIMEITGGNLTLRAYGDGIQAQTALNISGGVFDITTLGEDKETARPSRDMHWGWNANWDQEDEAGSVSRKGIKSAGNLSITGGSFTVSASDDALHANGSIAIEGGAFLLTAVDDGIHADSALLISGGRIEILDSYEGLEANQITLTGGDVTVKADDDGVNANGGTNSFGGPGGFGGSGRSGGSRGGSGGSSGGQGEAETAENTPALRITGGTLVVNADGDGLDSNGNLLMEGGLIIVNGPSGSGNGALDTGTENGGVCVISGGTVLAIGSSGMAESFDGEGSTQCSLKATLSQTAKAGDELILRKADGTVLFTHTLLKSANSVVFSCPEMALGDTILLQVGTQEKSITLNSLSVSDGRSRWGW